MKNKDFDNPLLRPSTKYDFESVSIGTQEWLTRNLDVDRFWNGHIIPHVESDEEWKKAGRKGQPAWCYYDNDSENGKEYGKLYNWFAVNDKRGLAPKGWHVPSYDEWFSLHEFLGGGTIAGYKIKSIKGWKDLKDENSLIIEKGNGNDSYGFNALPSGCRIDDGSFGSIRSIALFWSSSEEDDFHALYWPLYNNYRDVSWNNFDLKQMGFSVRCLRV